jgi:hypothetical protein
MTKITKTETIDAITLYFAKKGQRITNLKKSPMNKIEEIIKKYNLNMEELLNELKLSNEKKKEEKIQLEEQQIQLEEQQKKEREIKTEKRKQKWLCLDEEDKEKVKIFAYEDYVKTMNKKNEENKIMNDVLIRGLEMKGCRIERISDNEFKSNGITVHNGFQVSLEKINDKNRFMEDFNYWLKRGDFNYNYKYSREVEKLVDELYETRMIREGFTKNEDGEFYKIIRVKRKN